jgi:hypothetical protein
MMGLIRSEAVLGFPGSKSHLSHARTAELLFINSPFADAELFGLFPKKLRDVSR